MNGIFVCPILDFSRERFIGRVILGSGLIPGVRTTISRQIGVGTVSGLVFFGPHRPVGRSVTGKGIRTITGGRDIAVRVPVINVSCIRWNID